MNAIGVNCLTVEVVVGLSVKLTTLKRGGRRQRDGWRVMVVLRRPGEEAGGGVAPKFFDVAEARPIVRSREGCTGGGAPAWVRGDANGTDFGRGLHGGGMHGRC